jgi:hypothetical protein
MAKPEEPPKQPVLLPMNFTLTTAERLRAAAGPPAFALRLRRIEDLKASLPAAVAILEGLAPPPVNEKGEEVALGVIRARARRDFETLNRLIDDHNCYYPIEAKLRTDLHTRQYVQWGAPWEPMAMVTWEELVESARSATPG